MNKTGKHYIILDSEKRAIHGFKDGNGLKSWSEVKDYENIGLYVEEPFLVFDFDTVDDSNYIQKIVEGENLNCRIMKTTKGVHVWFKSMTPWKNLTKQRLACGIFADFRSWGRNGYVKIKDGGKMREWLKECPDEKLDFAPIWLRPVTLANFEFKRLQNGDSRNQKLFNYILTLQSKGFVKTEIREIVRIINTYIFSEPLPDIELKTILRDESFKSQEELDLENKNRKTREKFRHDVFADELLAENKILTLNDSVYIYDDHFYKRNVNHLKSLMVAKKSNITQAQRREVAEYIKIQTYIDYEDIPKNPYIVNLVNTRIDLRGNPDGTIKLLPFDDTVIEFERVPVVYNAEAYSAELDKMLNKVFCNDKEVLNLFCELVGDCLLKKNIFQKAFLFYGGGKNGKSTVLRLLRKFIGEKNCSTIELDRLCDTFMTAELENKLVNLGDDINYKAMTNTGTLKKLFSGEPLQVQYKQEKPFTMTPYATQIFSCNEIPKTADRSEGLYRRWVFVPFKAIFDSKNKDYDPMIEEKITTPEALSYLLNLALEGAKRLIHNGKFTEPKVVVDALVDYKRENSSVLQWIDDANLDEDYFLRVPAKETYQSYCIWCDTARISKPTGRNRYYKEIQKEYGFDNNLRFKKSDNKRYFAEDFNF